MARSGFFYKPLKNITVGEPGSSQQTAFGAIQVESLSPSAQGDFVYTINEKVFTKIKVIRSPVPRYSGDLLQ